MKQQIDLEKLSNQEIKELWRKTISEARKQRGAVAIQVQAETDLGFGDEEYYRDQFQYP